MNNEDSAPRSEIGGGSELSVQEIFDEISTNRKKLKSSQQ